MLLSAVAGGIIVAQQPPQRFGGAYSELDERRQQLVADWVTRFTKVTGQTLEAGSFYDDVLSLSTKTTFDAVTHALMTTPLTDASGQKFGDGLALIERVDTVKGEVSGTSGDRQFRLYVRLTPNAREMMDRSREFRRAIDNTVYHKGYPINYREQTARHRFRYQLRWTAVWPMSTSTIDRRASPACCSTGTSARQTRTSAPATTPSGTPRGGQGFRTGGEASSVRASIGLLTPRRPPRLLCRRYARGQEEHQRDGA